MRVTMELSGSEEYMAKLRARVGQIISGAEEVTRKHAFDVSGAIAAAAPRDTGKLSSSVRWSMTRKSGSEVVQANVRVGVKTKYVRYVEFGTITNKARKMPPWKGDKGIGPWARRHGLNPFVIARSMARNRTKSWKNSSGAGKSIQFVGAKRHAFAYPTFDDAKEPYKLAIISMVARVLA